MFLPSFVLRYVFSVGWVWMQELYIWIHATVFMLGAGYTLLHDGHVRIDLIYRTASPRYKGGGRYCGKRVSGWPADLCHFFPCLAVDHPLHREYGAIRRSWWSSRRIPVEICHRPFLHLLWPTDIGPFVAQHHNLGNGTTNPALSSNKR